MLAADRFGQSQRAFSFDGVTSHIDCGTRSAFNFGTNNFTLAAWIRPGPNATNRYVISKYQTPTPSSYGLATHNADQAYAFYYAEPYPAASVFSIGPSLADGGHHHVLATYTRGELLRIYVDGELRGSVDISGEPGPQENNFPLLIGNLVDGSTYGSQPFEGEIDDVRIYNRALTPSEVGQLYSAETPNHAPVS